MKDEADQEVISYWFNNFMLQKKTKKNKNKTKQVYTSFLFDKYTQGSEN